MTNAARAQPLILQPIAPVARSITFRIRRAEAAADGLRALAAELDVGCGIAGVGAPLVLAVGKDIPGLSTFPALSGAGCVVPSTQDALWIRLSGGDRGIVFDAARSVRKALAEAFEPSDTLDTFKYHGGRDLTRFEDGTENPQGDEAVAAAIVADGALAGSSFVAVQRWVHDLARFESFGKAKCDAVIGRSAETNDELDDAPESAHVKRTAQESFEPPAFMIRRSMPWAGAYEEGLEFVSFVASLDAFERMMRRMAGLEDGIVDALFTFSRAVTGGYYWCPPVQGGKLDLSALLDARR
jgi:putative iron-dependent peroxidase